MRPPLIHHLIERRAAELPSQTAVRHLDETLSYGALNERANRLAHGLMAAGVKPDSVVGICLPRGVDFVVALLGVLKAGAAYLPLEQSVPPARLRHMLAASRVTSVIGVGPTMERLAKEGMRVISPKEMAFAGAPASNPDVRIHPDNLAYVIYTSGSTGLPKGVMISHRSLSTFAAYYHDECQLTPADCTGMVAALGFDAAVMDILPPLAAGARLEVPDDEVRLSSKKLQEWMLARGVTFVFLSTPLAEPLLKLPWPQTCSLRLLLMGGDRLHAPPQPGLPFRLINCYGPTECTVYSTAGLVPPATEGAVEERMPSIGRAIPGYEVHILDEELRPVKAEETGEIYIGGLGLARGYAGAADLTAERFVPHPHSRAGGERLYRTGDLGGWLPDGTVDFRGRVDHQVKVRGIRIEPGEIAAALMSHPLVGAAHVLTQTTAASEASGGVKDTFFVAWFSPRDPLSMPDTEMLRTHLRDWLPEAMMPRTFVVMDALPLTLNGKVDVKALPVPTAHATRGQEYVAPRTDLERGLARVWESVLRLERVGTQDDFFELGGHSLVATQITNRIADELGMTVSLRELFTHSRIAQLAELLEPRRADPAQNGYPPLVRDAQRERAPLTVQQEQVWFLQKLSPDSISYQAQTTIRVLGALDVPVLERALTEITRRHEVLRTTYEEVDGRPWQVLRPVEPVQVPVLDLSGVPADERERRREEAVRQELRRPISLYELPLARFSVLRLAQDVYEIICVEHHVVHDGWSFSVLMRELETLYNAYLRGELSPLPELPVQYSDFAAWQRKALDSPGMQAQLAYWRQRLAGAPEVLPLRSDHPRPAVQSFNGDLLRLDLPPALPAALRVFCQQEGVTPFNTLFAAFATLLYRHTGERDLCIGSAFAARKQRKLDEVIGMFVNAVVLRCDVSGEPSFRDLVRQVRDLTAEAAENQTLPFVKVVEALGVKRDPSRNPLIQAMFSFHDSAVLNPRLGDAPCTVFERGNGSSKVDLDVVAIPHAGRHRGDASRSDGRISLLWEYNRDLFDRSTMERMCAQFIRLLEAAVASPDTSVSRLPLVSEAERHALLVDFNAGAAVPAPATLVHHQVLEQAGRTPHAVAVRDEAGSLTYAELVRRATLLAERLREQGACTDSVVGVCLPRGADLVTAELGVLLSGAAFLPLDSDHPADRLAFILADAGARQVVTTGALSSKLPATLEHVRVETVHAPGAPRAPLAADVQPGDLAYVMYTSGSTGRPKGVMVEHRALANLVAWQRNAFGLEASTRATLLYSPAFDPSAAEIWPALTVGASLYVPGQDVRLSPERLQAWLLTEHITFTDLPTALAERLLALPWPETCSLRTMLAGGDRLHARPAPGTPWRLYNQYGPTETTVTATSGLVEPEARGEALPTIGQPIAGATAYVLDGELQPVPVGVGGELYIGGAGVARGYLGRPDLTADRFVPDPFSPRPGARLYRTGDLVRHLPDGTLEFLGRADTQVKIRGFRVEPAEITALLRTGPGLAEAHVSARSTSDGETRLVGYLVPKADAAVPTPAQLREHLGRELPAYMIPSAYVVLQALPLTHSGKVDERALPEPAPLPRVAQAPLANELERQLAGTWREALRLEQVGAEDNFFDLGGHSLLLARVQHALKGLGHDVPMVKLFEFPTIRTLAGYLQGQDGGAEMAAAAQALRQEQRQSGRSRLQGRRGLLATDGAREDGE